MNLVDVVSRERKHIGLQKRFLKQSLKRQILNLIFAFNGSFNPEKQETYIPIGLSRL